MSTTRYIRRLSGCLAICIGLVLGACATGGAGTGEEGSTAVQVQNNLIPPTSLTIYVVPDIGSRRLIGTVQPGATRVLRWDPTTASGQFQFAAQTTAGREIVSNPVSLSRGATVRWDLTANLAVVTDG